MLTFFRRIRKGLLGDGATSKYLLYAIGEIALVVIGILIALALNQSIEERKLNFLQDELLTEIQSDLRKDSARLGYMQTRLDQIITCLDLLKDLPEYQDSLLNCYAWISRGIAYSPNTTAFETLKSLGIQHIKHRGLRRKIVELYAYQTWEEQNLDMIVTKFYDLEWIPFNRKFMTPFFNEDSASDKIWLPPENRDNSFLREYNNILVRKRRQVYDLRRRVSRLQEKCQELLIELSQYFNR